MSFKKVVNNKTMWELFAMALRKFAKNVTIENGTGTFNVHKLLFSLFNTSVSPVKFCV